MLVTFDTSQDDKFWLNKVAFSKIDFMLVTSDTSQNPIGPLSHLGTLLLEVRQHAETALSSSSLDFGEKTTLVLVVVNMLVGLLVTADVGLEVGVFKDLEVFKLVLGDVEMLIAVLKDLELVVAALLVVLGQSIDADEPLNIP